MTPLNDLDRDTPTALPIYMQISEFLIREIAAGRLVDGQRLPPEREMAKSHGTTVRTLRKSLYELEKKGFWNVCRAPETTSTPTTRRRAFIRCSGSN